ncbi:transcriptional regulator, TetR family [Saccharopolyspora kobensis]|uniref:Transcriptional regulator, TetR family n=1 Tax=Saccharopolyspora kobensis TaxID=146035 RepID=A0A1H6EF29_9PSEU|nr:TetR/AcrR family transcriptional regulator [Saccharopolyspora kobensis]SEG96390.1 transcriptional regulator, TetR family [Saccharopolyspora kobensis]SFD19779.1 transcriptional regulator, TetR family [Saccharopolyspora kobensis]
MSTQPSHLPELRVDARQNRDRIVEVARALFAERGLDVPMAAIARRAEVGVATLYRRFPTKESLITEAFADRFANCTAVVHEALDDPDPWRGFCSVLEKVFAMQADDRGFSAAFLAALPATVNVDQELDRALRSFAALADRAKEAGALRADFELSDLTLLLMANNGVTTPAASRRLLGYLLNSLRAEHAEPLPPPAPLSLRDLC